MVGLSPKSFSFQTRKFGSFLMKILEEASRQIQGAFGNFEEFLLVILRFFFHGTPGIRDLKFSQIG